MVAQSTMGRETTAQSKRFASGGMDCIKDWKTGEVGGAYLFEKSRGKAEKEVMGGRRLRQVATDDDGEGLRLEPRLRPTKGVRPNSSRKRSKLDAGSVGTLRDCPESIGPVRGLKDDFQEIGSLGYALIFETLRTTLLILLVIVRVGAAGAGYVEKWLDDEAIGG